MIDELKNKWKTMVQDNDLNEVLNEMRVVLPKDNDVVGFQSRIQYQNDQWRMGLVSSEDNLIAMNRIKFGLLSTIDDLRERHFNIEMIKNLTSIPKNGGSSASNVENLRTILSTYKRTNAAIYSLIVELIKGYEDYSNAKASNPLFDIKGRGIKSLDASYAQLMVTINDVVEEDEIGFVESIEALLSDDFPLTYTNMQKAYDLCRAKGMPKNVELEDKLAAKLEVDFAKVNIAIHLETWVATNLN